MKEAKEAVRTAEEGVVAQRQAGEREREREGGGRRTLGEIHCWAWLPDVSCHYKVAHRPKLVDHLHSQLSKRSSDHHILVG